MNRRIFVQGACPVLVFFMSMVILLSSCGDSQRKEAEQLLGQASQLFEQQRYDRALAVIDSLRKNYPTVIDIRKQALTLQQNVELKRSQEELAELDSTLQAVKRDYEQQKQRVEQAKSELRATADELTALTKTRIRFDSLQTRFEALCAKIQYIHKKQKE